MNTLQSVCQRALFCLAFCLLGFFFSTRTARSQVLQLTATTTSQTGTVGSYTVPSGGLYKYRITAKGAQGGNSFSYSGGKGATMQGDFVLQSDQIIQANAGAPGGNTKALYSMGGGGGGGSGAKLQDGAVLLVAGAGGGAGRSIGGSGTVSNNGSGGGSGFAPGGGGFSGSGSGYDSPGGGGGFNGFGGSGVGSGGGNGGGGFGGGGGGDSDRGGGGGGGYSGGTGGGYGSSGNGGGSINYGTNQANTGGANDAGGQVLIELIGPAAAFAPTLTATQPACGSFTGRLSIDLTGDFNNSTNSVEYAIVTGDSFSGSPAFTTITSEPLAVTSGTGISAAPGGSTYTVRVRLIYNPTIFYDYTYILTPPPTRLYVNANASGNNTGLSWNNAFTDLQSALRYTNNQCLTEIWVAQGIYKPDSFFRMLNGVAIYGGFGGYENNLSDRPNVNPVSGSPANSTLVGATGSIIFNSDGTTSSAVLDGFVITGGKATFGGAMYNQATAAGQVCSPTIRNCAFLNNSADQGGAIHNYGSGNSSPTLVNCLFQNNSASNQGGAIYNLGLGNSSPSLINCLFLSNSASEQGGAIYNNGALGTSSPTLTNCSFVANSAKGGGAIYNFGTSGNSSPLLTNCSFLQNASTSDGGAIVNYGLAGKSSPVLTNCSFLSNSATSQGGALITYGTAGVATPSLTNCVLFGNGGSKSIYNESGSLTASYSLLDNTVTGYSNGGNNLTTTTSPFASTTSVALSACSPAIDAGLNSASGLSGITTDLDGKPRFYNNGRIDMGAVEFQGAPFAVSAGSSLPQANVGVTVSLTASGATSYQWTAPATAPLTGPANASITSSSLTTAGLQTFTVVGTSGVCSQTALVSLTALTGPDLSPLLQLPSGGFAPNQTKALLVQIQEVNGGTASGPILITITVPSGYSISFDNTLTSIELGGSPTPVLNAKWQISSSAGSQQLRLSLTSGESVSPHSTMNLGVWVSRTTANTGSFSNITVNVADDSSGSYDVNRLNNIYARIINGL